MIKLKNKIRKLLTPLLLISFLITGCGSDSGIYNAGSYTATVEGYAGDVTVKVEFDNASIVSVIVTEQNETMGIGERAVEELPAKIVESQTWEVDAIASATITGDAIQTAVKDCMEQARSDK